MTLTQQSTRPPFAGHPAYDAETRDYIPTPRPAPRVKPEALENAVRNRGSIDFSWNVPPPQASSTDLNYGKGRYNSDQGRTNLMRSYGTVGNILQAKGPTEDTSVRCKATKPEAQQTANKSQGGRMNLLISNYGKNEVTPRPVLRVKSEATANYEMSRGGAMNKLLHNAKSMPATARLGPRVKPEAEMIAMKNRGSMNSIMRVCTPRY